MKKPAFIGVVSRPFRRSWPASPSRLPRFSTRIEAHRDRAIRMILTILTPRPKAYERSIIATREIRSSRLLHRQRTTRHLVAAAYSDELTYPF